MCPSRSMTLLRIAHRQIADFPPSVFMEYPMVWLRIFRPLICAPWGRNDAELRMLVRFEGMKKVVESFEANWQPSTRPERGFVDRLEDWENVAVLCNSSDSRQRLQLKYVGLSLRDVDEKILDEDYAPPSRDFTSAPPAPVNPSAPSVAERVATAPGVPASAAKATRSKRPRRNEHYRIVGVEWNNDSRSNALICEFLHTVSPRSRRARPYAGNERR